MVHGQNPALWTTRRSSGGSPEDCCGTPACNWNMRKAGCVHDRMPKVSNKLRLGNLDLEHADVGADKDVVDARPRVTRKLGPRCSALNPAGNSPAWQTGSSSESRFRTIQRPPRRKADLRGDNLSLWRRGATVASAGRPARRASTASARSPEAPATNRRAAAARFRANPRGFWRRRLRCLRGWVGKAR